MEKKDIAVIQLRTAAKLYKQGNYICSITLSGAAEEILGKIVKKRKGNNQLESNVEYLKSGYEYFNGKIPSNKELIEKFNRVKNNLKHNDNGENEWVEANFENEAVLIFVRAVKNYYDSYNQFPKDRIINNLFEDLTL